MTFYWITWESYNGDPMGITLLKCTDLVLTNKQEMFLKAKIIKTDLPNVHKMGVSIFKINLKKKTKTAKYSHIF